MARERRKAPKQEAPQTIEDATALAARYVFLLDQIETERLDAQKIVDARLALRDTAIAPIEDEAKTIFRQLRPWWASNRDELTDGKRKSIELAGALIGERTTTPALSLPKGVNLAGFVEWLRGRGLTSLLRIKFTVDKPACIKALRTLGREEPGLDAPDSELMEYILQSALGEQLHEKGASVAQKDEFFIDRVPPKDGEKPELVEVESEGAAA